MNCCDHDCRQGRDCPMRQCRVIHDSDGLTLIKHYCELATLKSIAAWALIVMVLTCVGLAVWFIIDIGV